MFILVACSNKNEDNSANIDKVKENQTIQISTLEQQNEELQAALENIQMDFNYTKDKAAYYKQLTDDLIRGYSDTQLKDLAIKLWDYELKVNRVTVPANGLVDIQENTIEISLTEKRPAYPVLPDEILIQGQLSENYTEHIKMNATPTETYFTEGTVVTGIHHKFEDVQEDSTVVFTITEELKKRLGLETTRITINRKSLQ